MKVALATVIESSNDNLGPGAAWKEWDDTNPDCEPLEEEAIRCFTAWRKRGGWLADADIYCVCPSHRLPSSETVRELEGLGVTYIEKFFSETDGFDCGYMNVPLACAWLEDQVDADFLVHVDLDMVLMQPLPQHLFNVSVTVGALCDEEMKPWQLVEVDNNFESCFIIASRESGFFGRWWYEARTLPRFWSIPEKISAETEEYAIDAMLAKGMSIHPLFHYQVGFRYNPANIPDENIPGVLFHHNHMYESKDNFDEFMRRKLRWRS